MGEKFIENKSERKKKTKSNFYEKGKRFIDIVGSTTGIVILSPILLATAIAIKIEDPKGKIFFAQRRIGLNGVEFEMYKLRSMVHNLTYGQLFYNKLLY